MGTLFTFTLYFTWYHLNTFQWNVLFFLVKTWPFKGNRFVFQVLWETVGLCSLWGSCIAWVVIDRGMGAIRDPCNWRGRQAGQPTDHRVGQSEGRRVQVAGDWWTIAPLLSVPKFLEFIFFLNFVPMAVWRSQDTMLYHSLLGMAN